jgi:hypothetical protein
VVSRTAHFNEHCRALLFPDNVTDIITRPSDNTTSNFKLKVGIVHPFYLRMKAIWVLEDSLPVPGKLLTIDATLFPVV